jgi:predicted ester cyclase
VGDARATVTDLIAEGERVVVYWRLQGTHLGPLWNVPASGNSLDGRSISLITFRAGRIVDYQFMADRLGLLQQMRAPAVVGLV